MKYVTIMSLLLSLCVSLWADCPLDHLKIGINPDGELGTSDDAKLFVDSTQKYRHSDTSNTGAATWKEWYYPMYFNPRYDRYQIGEPGFDLMTDPNQVMQGHAGTDHQVIIECVSKSPDILVKNSTLGIVIDQPGQWIDYYTLSDTHLHLEYRVSASHSSEMQWVSFKLKDQRGHYQDSDVFSIVFLDDPMAGDIVLDRMINLDDFCAFAKHWMSEDNGKANDYAERTDMNRDGTINLADLLIMIENWMVSN